MTIRDRMATPRSVAAFARSVDEGGADRATTALLVSLAAARADLEARSLPRAEFRTALRGRLLAVAAVQPDPVPAPGPLTAAVSWSRSRRGSRLAAACAGGLAAVVAVTGIAVGATRSLPGQPLYGAKQVTEAVQLRAADGPLEEGLQQLHFAETRLREVRALAAGQGSLALAGSGTVLAAGTDAARIAAVLGRMDDETRSGSGLVARAARDSGDATPLSVLQLWSGQQADRLRSVSPTLPGRAQQRAQASLSLVAGVGDGAAALLVPGCLTGAPAGCPDPGGLLPR